MDDRQKKFFDSLHTIKSAPPGTSAAPAQPPSSVVTPPANAAPSQQVGGFATFGDLNDAAVRGTITTAQYEEQKRQRGW